MKLSPSPAYPMVSMWLPCSTCLRTNSLSMIDVFSFGVVYRAMGAVCFNAVIGCLLRTANQRRNVVLRKVRIYQ